LQRFHGLSESHYRMISNPALESQNSLKQAMAYLKQSNSLAAIALCQEQISLDNTRIEFWHLLSQAHQSCGEFDPMLEAIQTATTLQPHNFQLQIRLIECYIYCGEVKKAIATLDKMAKNTTEANKLARIAELYLHCSQHQKVAHYHQLAVNSEPNNPLFLYNLAAAKINLGDSQASEALLNKVIALSANDFDAYTMRSGLRTASLKNNNISHLQELYASNFNHPQAKIALGFALAKEYEDMQQWDESWNSLKKANTARRKQMHYRVENDVQAINHIIQTITAQNLGNSQDSGSNVAPIFIVGLPRSGTTLVDRLLSSHTHVASLGEINSFAFSLIHSVGHHQGKQQLIEKSSRADFAFLAKNYSQATRGYGMNEAFLIDKTPLNFLYIGLIKKAFPKAKIIHLQRHPLDSCFAMYKTVFRMGYPFSYSLEDLSQYYIAYHRLMQHWRKQFPHSIYDLSYEKLVTAPEQQAKSLLNYCQLDWQEQVLDMHLNTAPTATASATQVRQRIYSSSVGKWKRYKQHLQPLQSSLQTAGIHCEK